MIYQTHPVATSDYIFDSGLYPWHSPRYVLEAYDSLIQTFNDQALGSKDFEKAREARLVAISLLGIHELTKRHYLMQVSRENSPDIVTMFRAELKGMPVHGFFQEVEVVSFDKNSPETDVVEFLKRTKLSPKYSYDNKTIILCEVKRDMRLPPYETIHTRLKELNPLPTVIIIGKISPEKLIYKICQIWPTLDLLTDIDVFELANKYPSPHNLQLTKGSDHQIKYGKRVAGKPGYFEVFGLDEIKLKKKYKVEETRSFG
jgi:hypothetical protein